MDTLVTRTFLGKKLVGKMYKTNETQEVISVEEFTNEWYNQQEYMLVDIREQEEINNGNAVKGTFNISMYDIPEQIEMAPTYIVCLLVCDNGARAEQVVKYLKNNDYNNMFAIEGGVDALLSAVPELKV